VEKELSDAAIPEEGGIQAKGLLSEGSPNMQTSQVELTGSTQEPAETIGSDAGQKPEQRPKKAFWLRYRSELIAATLLLLIAIGGRQVYIELENSRNSKNQAALTLKPDQVEEALVELPIKPELREEAGKPTQQQIPGPPPVIVENDLSLEVVEDAFVDVQLAETIPTTAREAQTIAVGKEEKTLTETSETNELMTDQYIEGVVVSRKSKNAGRLSQEMDEEETAEAEIFMVVEESPQFPGGDEARIRFLAENISYPAEAREASIQGTVYITFVIEKDGTIADVRVLRGIGGGCDEEAVRVIRKMPRWLPGKQRGKPVRVQFNMPIKFSMAG
jgi:protein TonB